MSTSPTKGLLLKKSLLAALNLLAFTLIGTSILASTFFLTRDRIRQSEEAEKLKLITQILPPALFDNNIIKDTLTIAPNPLLGNTVTTIAYRARLRHQSSAIVLEAIAPDGYGGKINLIMTIRSNGDIAGVRVISHKETPGLGDYIELTKSNWIMEFNGKSLATYKENDWQVKKDGGQFDYIAGATITPRAVVKAIHKALIYFEMNRDAFLKDSL